MKTDSNVDTFFPLKVVFPIYAAIFLSDATGGILGIALPIYVLRNGGSSLILGLIGGARGFTYFVAAMITGRITRKLDRRIILPLAFLLQSGTSFAYHLSTDFSLIILLSALQGFAYGTLSPNMESLLSDKVLPAHLHKALTGFNISWSTGTIIGPFLAGLAIQYVSLNWAFYIATGFPLIMLALVVLSSSKKIQEKIEEETHNVTLNEIDALRKQALLYFLVFLFAFSGGIVGRLFPALAVSLDISVIEISSITLFTGLTRTLCFVLNPILIKHMEGRTIITLGSILVTLSAVIFATGSTVWIFILGMIFLGLGNGMSYTTALTSILSGDRSNRGMRAGLFEGMIGFGSIIGPMLGGALGEIALRLPYATLAIFTFVFLIYQIVTVWIRKTAMRPIDSPRLPQDQ